MDCLYILNYNKESVRSHLEINQQNFFQNGKIMQIIQIEEDTQYEIN